MTQASEIDWQAAGTPLIRLWLLSDQKPTQADLLESAGYARAVLQEIERQGWKLTRTADEVDR